MMASLVDVRRRITGLRPEVWTATALSLLLLAYGNGMALFSEDARERFLLWSNLGLMVILLIWAFRGLRATVFELGLDPRNAGGSALIGAVLSVIAAVPPVLFIALTPLVTGDPVDVPEISDRSGAQMASFLLFRQPIGTALFEEVAFRGVLYAAWARAGGDKAAVLATSTVFSVWHVVITGRTVAESGVVEGLPLVVPGVIVALIGLFIGGLLFAYLRWHTQSIAAATVAHWLIVAFMAITVWSMA